MKSSENENGDGGLGNATSVQDFYLPGTQNDTDQNQELAMDSSKKQRKDGSLSPNR